MRFRIRTAVVETSLCIKYYRLNINTLKNKDASSEKSLYINYYKVKINALKNKDASSR
jgi:hypothetical protein